MLHIKLKHTHTHKLDSLNYQTAINKKKKNLNLKVIKKN